MARDSVKGVNGNETTKTVMESTLGNSEGGDNTAGDNEHLISRSPKTEEELKCETRDDIHSPTEQDDNSKLSNGERALEGCNGNPDEEVTEELPKDSLKRNLSQPKIGGFLIKNGDPEQSLASKKLKLDVEQNTEIVCIKELGVEGDLRSEDIGKERKENVEECADADGVKKEDENTEKYKSREECGDENYARKENGGVEDEAEVEDDGPTGVDEGQKDAAERDHKGQMEEGEGQKEDNDKDDKEGLPSGWSRLCVPRKNGTQVDYYLTNPQGQKFRSQKEVDRWLDEEGQDLQVTLKPRTPLPKHGQDIRQMFNGVGPSSTKASKKEEQKRMSSPCKVEPTSEEIPSSDCKTDGLGEKDKEAPTTPLKRKRGRPKKTESSAQSKEVRPNEELKPRKDAALLSSERPHRGCRESRHVVEEHNEEEEVDDGKAASGDHKKRQKSKKFGSKENIDPITDDKLTKKGKKTTKEASPEELNEAGDDGSEGSEDMDVVNESYLEEIAKFMEATDLGLIPDPPTKGDGNCWYRAAAEQVIVHSIPRVPKEHLKLRKEISDHLKNLPKQVKEDTINVVFVGKPRGLSDLAHRQRKPGQWVDNMGVMVMATAHYLRRNIHLIGYDPPGHPTERGYSLTVIEGEGGEDYAPLTIFYHDSHYQTLRPLKPARLSTTS